MVITGIKRTRIIRELPPERAASVNPGLARRVWINGAAGMSVQQIAAKLGISKSLVVRALATLSSLS